MKKRLNFKEFDVYAGVDRRKKRQGDVRESFADIVYNTANGIRGHALALKIYNSEGGTDFTDEEVEIMRNIAGEYCLPGFIDGLNDQLEGGKQCE